MSTIYSTLDTAQNEIRILQLRSIASTVAPNVHPFKIANLVDSNPNYLSTDAPIQCKLKSVRQGYRPQYQALSYTWGNAISPTPITVNGVEVPVTENLLAALKRFREQYSDVDLWVDALCINQVDGAEKAEQVKRMGDIYRNAARTLIWLGPEDEDSHNTISQLVKMGHAALKGGKIGELLKSVVKGGSTHQLMTEIEVQLSETFSQYLHDLPLALKFLNGCSSLLARPYWSRAWVIQEFVVSPNVFLFCGRDEIAYTFWQPATMALPLLRNFLLRGTWVPFNPEAYTGQGPHFDELLEINLDSTTMYGLIGTRSGYHFGFDERQSLFTAICSAHMPWKSNATDDRDLVFALLGLTSDAWNIGLSPNYDESTTCEQVYTSAARSIIYQGDVDVLSLSQHHTQGRPQRLPSWVPDWRVQIRQPFGQSPVRCLFKASGSATFSTTIGYEHLPKNQVKLLGYRLSHVELPGTKSWCPPYEEDLTETIHRNAGPYLRSIRTLCQKSDVKLKRPQRLPDPYPHPTDRASAEMSIPVSGMELYGKNLMPRHANNPLEDHTDLEKGFLGAKEATRLEDSGAISHETGGYFQAMKLQTDRRGILLNNGLVGTGPKIVEAGDAVVIFKGAKIPYALRRKEEGDLISWTLVGAAYIHGIMYGELFEKSFAPKGLQLEEFLLIN